MNSVHTFKKAAIFGAAALALASTASAQVMQCENFSYADGPTIGNGIWESHSGTAGTSLIASGQIVIEHGTPSEDVNIPFPAVGGVIYFGIDFSVDDPGGIIPGTDNEYFAHFKDDSFGFAARLDIVPAPGGGDFSVGIASDDSTADATWATDLTYGTTYRAVVSYDQDLNIAELWIDPVLITDTRITGDDKADPGDSITRFGLRQSDSDMNETIRVDNLVVSSNFDDVVAGVGNCGSQTPRFSVAPNPAVLNQGNSPLIGSIWNPSVTSTGSVTDLILISFLPAIDVPTSFGSLLCDLNGSIMLTGAAGVAFALPIPTDPAFIGLGVCAQGAGLGLVVELTNALDVVIGG